MCVHAQAISRAVVGPCSTARGVQLRSGPRQVCCGPTMSVQPPRCITVALELFTWCLPPHMRIGKHCDALQRPVLCMGLPSGSSTSEFRSSLAKA
jgi:hypothetical protein